MRILILLALSALGAFGQCKPMPDPLHPGQMTCKPGLQPDKNGNYSITNTLSVGGSFSANTAPTVALFGDSITNQCLLPDVSPQDGRGYSNWMAYLMNERVNVVAELGTSGNTTTQMLARVSEVLALSPRPQYTIVEGGINDLIGGATAASVLANLTAIYSALRAGGVQPIATTVTPSDSLNTAGKKAAWATTNRLIREYARSNYLLLVDLAGSYLDTANTSPVALANTTADGTHPTVYGAYLLGKTLATTLDRVFPPLPVLPVGNSDTDNVLLNATMTGTGGSVVGGSGQCATSWTCTGNGATLTASKIARADGGPGAAQRISVTYTVDAGIGELKQVVDVSAHVGKQMHGLVEVLATSDWQPQVWQCFVRWMNAGGSEISRTTWQFGSGGAPLSYAAPGPGVIRIPKMQVPVGTVNADLRIQIVGANTKTATIDYGRVALYVMN